MKKILSALLVGLLIFSCTAACNNTKNTTSPTEEHTHTHTTAPETTEATETTPVATETPTEETTVLNTPLVLSKGAYSENKYINNILNLSFTLPTGWMFYEDADLCSLSGISPDAYADFETAAKNNPAVYDMYAIYNAGEASVSLCYENLLLTTGSLLSEKEYLDVITSAVSGAGVSEIVNNGTINFCGETYESATITSGDGAIKTQKTYYLKAADNYMITLIITTTPSVPESEVSKAFS